MVILHFWVKNVVLNKINFNWHNYWCFTATTVIGTDNILWKFELNPYLPTFSRVVGEGVMTRHSGLLGWFMGSVNNFSIISYFLKDFEERITGIKVPNNSNL